MDHEEERVEAGTMRVYANEDMSVTGLQIQCPVCHDWCNAEIEQEGMVVASRSDENVVQIHMHARFHVHDHDCMIARQMAAELGGEGIVEL